MTKKRVNRRNFLKTTASASALALTATSYAKVAGANDKLRIGFLGVGGRCQQHIDEILKMQKEGKAVVPVAVCDVWDGDPKLGRGQGRGLYPSAKRCGIQEDKNHVTKDYRRILDLKDVDVVSIATPDHWHARMSIDAMKAGKDVYCEKPMTRTIAEAQAVVDAAKETSRVMTVGVQSMADPTWHAAYNYLRSGNIGKVLQGQTSYYRNYIGGQWRYYPLKKEMTPKTIDWDTWLGYKFDVNGVKLGPPPEKMPFDRGGMGAVALLLAVRRRYVHRSVRASDDAPDFGAGRALSSPRGRRRRHLSGVRWPRCAGRGHGHSRLRRGLPTHHFGDDVQ